jgi:hypothetical protein
LAGWSYWLNIHYHPDGCIHPRIVRKHQSASCTEVLTLNDHLFLSIAFRNYPGDFEPLATHWSESASASLSMKHSTLFTIRVNVLTDSSIFMQVDSAKKTEAPLPYAMGD